MAFPVALDDRKKLEKKIREAGKILKDPPSSAEELVSVLEKVADYLSMIGKSHLEIMNRALCPLVDALFADKLLRHSDTDVKVAVAVCISHITRMTRPYRPYETDKMGEMFQLIVSSFENLRDSSSRSYANRKSILKAIADVNACIIMLKLKFDALILEMFQHFFNEIREHHPDDVFSSMEKIIMLVLEQSDDISLHLLFVLLNSIKKDNEEGSAGRKLGERVLEKCIAKKIANKIRPKLVQAVKTLGVSVDEYSSVLASVFQDKKLLVSLGEDGECVTGELVEDKGDSEKQSPEKATQVVKEEAGEAVHSQQDNPDQNRSPKSVMSNGVTSIREDNALADTKSIKKQEDADCSDHSKDLVKSGYEELNDLNAEKIDTNQQKPEKAAIDSVETAGALESDEEIDAKISSPKTCNAEPEVVASPSPSGESLPSKKAFEGTSNSEAKPANRPGKKALGWNSDVKKSAEADPFRKGSEAARCTNAKKHSAKKLDENNGCGGGSSSRQLEDKKKSQQGKSKLETRFCKILCRFVDKEMVSSPRFSRKSTKVENLEETPKTNANSKHTSGKKFVCLLFCVI